MIFFVEINLQQQNRTNVLSFWMKPLNTAWQAVLRQFSVTTRNQQEYNVTFCVMACTDPVALNVAATNLMCFNTESIPLLEDANKNGIGETDPAYIRIHRDRAFSRVRLHLWNQFAPDKFPPPPPTRENWSA